METTAFLPTMLVKVKMDSCNAYSTSKQLKKSLFKIDGVRSVEVDTEKELVTILGKAELAKVLKAISKIVKNAELLSYKKDPCFQTAAADDETSSMNNKKSCKKDSRRKKGKGCCSRDEVCIKQPQVCKDPFCTYTCHSTWSFFCGFLSLRKPPQPLAYPFQFSA